MGTNLSFSHFWIELGVLDWGHLFSNLAYLVDVYLAGSLR